MRKFSLIFFTLLYSLTFISCDDDDIINDNQSTDESEIIGITDIVVDNEDVAWVGTSNGLYKLDDTSQVKFSTIDGLPSDHISCLVLDKTGKIWIGTDLGISNYTGDIFVNYNTGDGLVNNDVRSIAVDKENNIWVGTSQNSVSMYDGMDFTNYNIDGTIGHIHTITCDSTGNIWVGSCMNGLSMYDPSGGTWTYGIESFNVFVETSYCDANGDVWICYPGGTYKQDADNWTKIELMDVIDHLFVYDIEEDANNNFWLATYSGLYYFNGTDWNIFLTKDGLKDIYIKCLEADNIGNLWIGTNKGISKISINDKPIITNDLDGFWQGKTSNNDDCYLLVDDNKIMYFGYGERIIESNTGTEIAIDKFAFYAHNYTCVKGEFTDQTNANGEFRNESESFTWNVTKTGL